MIPEIHLLTARPKMEIVKILHLRHAPDEIASELGMTRQAVDKNLKDLVKYGIVTRTWKNGPRRPRVEFSLTQMGTEFYGNLEKLIRNYRLEGKANAIQMLRELDLALIKKEVSPERYMESMEEIKRQYEWFLDSSQ